MYCWTLIDTCCRTTYVMRANNICNESQGPLSNIKTMVGGWWKCAVCHTQAAVLPGLNCRLHAAESSSLLRRQFCEFYIATYVSLLRLRNQVHARHRLAGIPQDTAQNGLQQSGEKQAHASTPARISAHDMPVPLSYRARDAHGKQHGSVLKRTLHAQRHSLRATLLILRSAWYTKAALGTYLVCNPTGPN